MTAFLRPGRGGDTRGASRLTPRFVSFARGQQEDNKRTRMAAEFVTVRGGKIAAEEISTERDKNQCLIV